jgi:DNA-directed RNA polymerase specialized sigma24 family protein
MGRATPGGGDLGDDKDVGDATQETLLRAPGDSVVPPGSQLRNLLATITVNAGCSRQKAAQAISLEWLRNRADPDQTGVSNLVDQRLQSQALWRLVDRMDEKHRLPLLLVYQENLPAAEAAQVLNLPIRTLYARLKHAYDELSVQLEGQALPEAPEMVVNDVQ